MSNHDTAPFELNQFGAWYLLAGIEQYLKSADMEQQCDTLLAELERLRQWDEAHGGWYDHVRYRDLAVKIRAVRAELRRDFWMRSR